MTQEQFNAQWAELNAQAKAGTITVDELMAKRKALTETQAQATAQVKAAVQAEAKAQKQHVRAEAIAASSVQTLSDQDARVRYLESKLQHTGHKLKPSDYVAAQVLLRTAKEQLDAAARLMGVAE